MHFHQILEILCSGGGKALERLLKEAVDVPSLEVFQGRVTGALGSLIQWEVSQPTAGVGTRSSLRSLSTEAVLRFSNSRLLL